METVEDDAVALLTADVALFAPSGGDLCALLIKRMWPPFEGAKALPGGFLRRGEASLPAAIRELEEETGLRVPGLRRVGFYDRPDRDPRGRVVSAAYTALLREPLLPTAASDAAEVDWVPLRVVVAESLAFDHDEIIGDALKVWGFSREFFEKRNAGSN